MVQLSSLQYGLCDVRPAPCLAQRAPAKLWLALVRPASCAPCVRVRV